MLLLDLVLAAASMAIMLAMAFFWRRQLPDDWAEGLSSEQRRIVKRSINKGTPPEDPRLHPATDELVRTRLATLDSRRSKVVRGLLCVPMAVFWGAATSAFMPGKHTGAGLVSGMVTGVIFAVVLLFVLNRYGRNNLRRARTPTPQ